MTQDIRRDEESITERRARVLGLNYIDTSQLQKALFKGILTVQEMYSMRVVPIFVDAHNVNFGITTTTSQQTLNALKERFTDQIVSFELISDTGYKEYMTLYDPPKKVEYQDISFSKDQNDSDKIISTVSATLDKVRPDDMLAYLVQQAHRLKASDIHLECQRENVRIRYRVDGVLHPIAYLGYEKYRHLSSAIASAANVTTSAEDAQQGHISRQYKMATGEE